MISSQAKNPNCMYMWMDHIVSPEANAGSRSGSVRRRATCRAATSPPIRTTVHVSRGRPEYWTDVWYWTTATEECLDGRTDVTACRTPSG